MLIATSFLFLVLLHCIPTSWIVSSKKIFLTMLIGGRLKDDLSTGWLLNLLLWSTVERKFFVIHCIASTSIHSKWQDGIFWIAEMNLVSHFKMLSIWSYERIEIDIYSYDVDIIPSTKVHSKAIFNMWSRKHLDLPTYVIIL